MHRVYDLWFIREYEDRDETELHIGIYASEADAKAAIAQLADRPGFCEHPQGFEIHEVELGRTAWRGGFTTRFGPPPKDAGAEAFDLPVD